VRKIVLYAAVSLDRFIARKDGSIDWLPAPDTAPGGEDFGYRRFIGSIDTLLAGYTTYRQVRKMEGGWPYEGKTSYIFTRSHTRRPVRDVHFVSRNIPRLIRNLRRQKGKNIWLVGGSQVNTILLNLGLIDRIVLTVIPVALGSGIPLFTERAKPTRFVRAGQRPFAGGIVQLIWNKKRRGQRQ
jgi:dihydrofolate reductase